MDVGTRLLNLLRDRGWSIYTLSKKSNVAWNTIKNITSERSDPTITTLELLCNGFGITLVQFFDEGKKNLTAEQQYVLNRWDTITPKQKKVISEMLDIMLTKKM